MTAIPQEHAALVSLIDGAEHADGFDVGWLGGSEVVAAMCGMGKVNAAMLATRLIERFAPSTIVFSGVAGGLDPALGVGDVVIGEVTIQHDTGVLGPVGFEPYQAGHIPFFNPTTDIGFRPSPDLLARCRTSIAGVEIVRLDGVRSRPVFGTILTGDQFVANAEERRSLFDRYGAQAVEMEGGAVAQVAEASSVDHVIIRALSDLAGDDSGTDFTLFVSRAVENSMSVLSSLIPGVAAS